MCRRRAVDAELFSVVMKTELSFSTSATGSPWGGHGPGRPGEASWWRGPQGGAAASDARGQQHLNHSYPS